MIQFANIETMPLVRNMWKICFEDSEEFLDLHFSCKYKNENTLIFFQEGEAVASLQMFPYTITFYKQEVPFYYLAGLCTLPQHRKKGYMAQLIYASHKVMQERGIPLSILVPAEDWLFGFYEKYDYEQIFDGGRKTVPLKRLLDSAPNLEEAYNTFNLRAKKQDFYVQKTFEDFKVIADEFRIDGYPVKYNLSGMACIIDDRYLIGLYNAQAKKEGLPEIIKTNKAGVFSYIIDNGEGNINIEIDVRLLCRLLFGYKTKELGKPFADIFPEHHPVMNLMLE